MKKIFIFLLCWLMFGTMALQAQTPITTFPWEESFENGASIPAGWTTQTVTGSTSWNFVTVSNNSDDPQSGSYMAEFFQNEEGDVTKLITPEFDFTGLSSPELSFYQLRRSWIGDIDELRVYYKTQSATTWTLFQSFTSEMSVWTNSSISLSAVPTTEPVQFAFEATSNYGHGVQLDNIQIFTCASSIPTLSSATSTSASFSWDENENVLGWLTSYRENNGVWSDDELITDNEYDIPTILTPNTQYEFRIRTLCGVGDTSSYNTLSFTTLIEAVNTPFFEDFEGSNHAFAFKNGTQRNQWMVGSAAGAQPTGSSNSLYISDNASSYNYNNLYTSHTYAYTLVDITDAGAYQFNYDWKVTGEGGFDYAQAWLAPSSANFNAGSSPSTTGWINIHGENMQLSTGWVHTESAKTVNQAGLYYLIFYWKNDGSGGNNPPIAIDNVSIERMPCDPLISVTTSDPQIDGITMEFGLNSSTTDIRVYYKPVSASEFDSVDIAVSDLTNNQYVLTGLNASSTYTYSVVAVCDEGNSLVLGPFNFSTTCATITNFPWSEGFEADWVPAAGVGNKPAPNCWTVIDRGTTTHSYGTGQFWWTRGTTTHSGSGAAQCYTDYGATDHNDWLITPEMTLTGNERLRFWAMRSTSATTEPDEISIFISDEDLVLDTVGMGTYDTMPGFTRIFHQALPVGDWARYEVNLDQYTGNRYIAFVRQGTPDGYNLRLDDVLVEPIPGCTSPHSIIFSNITETSVEIDFTAGNSTDNAWRLYYRTTGSNAYDSVDISYLPFELNSLLPSTNYQIYLRTNCGNEFSEETSVSIFSTLCGTISSFPWSEGFETDWVPAAGVGNKPSPNCWTVIDRGGVSGSSSYWWTHGTIAHTGAGAAQCYTDYGTTNHNDWLITPEMTLTGNERLRFWAMRSNSTTGEPDEISIFISDEDAILDTVGMGTYDTMPGFTRIFHQDLPVGNWARYEVNLNQYTGNRYIAFVRQGTPDGYNLRLDDVLVEPLPNCTSPHSMSVANLSQTGADIHFLPGNVNDAAWRVYYKATTTTNWDSVDVTSSPAQLTGLTANTTYQYYMITDCGNEISEATNTHTFSTPCNYITIPYLENFDTYSTGTTAAMSCWTRKTNQSATTNYPFVSSTNSSSPSNSLYFYGYNTTYECAAASPVDVTVNPINTLKVKFKIRSTTANAASRGIQVGVMTDPSDYSSFVPVGGYHKSSTTSAFEEKSVSLASYTGTGNFIAIRSTGTGGTTYYNYNYVDDFEIVELSDCEQPDMALSNITVNSVDISILAGNIGDNAWWLYYKPVLATAWDSVQVTTNPFTLTPIQPSTNYQAYIRTDCGGELSLPSLTKTFQTQCGAITGLPIMDDFESYGTGESVMPICWTRTTTYTNRPYVYSGSGNPGNCLYFYAGTAGTYNIAAMPEIDASIPVNTLMVTFDAKASVTDSLYVGVMTNPSDASTFEVVGQIQLTNGYVTYEIPLTNYAGTGQYIAFKVQYGSTGPLVYMDNLVVDLTPACPNPQNFTVTGDSPTSALLDWDEDPSVVSRTLEYKLSADATWTTDPSVTAPPYTISSLTAENFYDFRLKLHCGGTDESNYKYVSTYVGRYCFPNFTSTSTTYFTSSVSTTGADVELVDATVCTPLTYYNRTALPFEVTADDEISFTVVHNGGTQGIALWVDLDNSNSFEASERLYNTTSYQSSPHTGTFTIPSTTAAGTYRVRLQIDGSNSNPSNPCQNNTGNIIDYAVVVAPCLCASPTNFTATQSSPTSALLDWVEPTNVVSRTLEYKLSSDATWTADPSVTAPPYTLGSLTSDNTYDFRLKFNCGGTDESRYKTASTFVGYYCYPTFTGSYTTYYTNSVTTTGASITDLNDNTVCTQKTYYDRTTLPFEVLSGDVITFTATYAGGTHGIAIWVDFNNSNSFEANERVYNTTSYQSNPHSGTITIPANTPNGSYRIRMQVDGYNSNPTNPCQNVCGNIIDYTMVVGGMTTPCDPPTNLRTVNVTSQTAEVSWTAGGSETEWIVEHRKGTDNYGTQRVTQTSATLTGLDPDTQYDLRVKAVCATDNESAYTEITFTTREDGEYYTITPVSTFGGDINPNTPQQVAAGGSQLFTFSVENGYQIEKVLINDQEEDWNTTDNSYQFTNVQQDYTIKVVFSVGIDDRTLNQSVEIFPNPTNSLLHVKTESLFQTVEITNMLGQVIYKTTINDLNFSINVSQFNAGVYFIKLSGENGNAVKKFVVN